MRGNAAQKKVQFANWPTPSDLNSSHKRNFLHLALETRCSLYDCLYLALAETIDGKMVTADGKFHKALANSRHSKQMLWVEDLPLSIS